MATLRSAEPSATVPAPLSTSEEQARILRACARQAPGGLAPEEDLALEGWERDLLLHEARWSQDVRSEALTLLRARAAEWTLRRRLGDEAIRDERDVDAAAALLDRVLADIGTTLETTRCLRPEGLEALAARLHVLYDSLAETSLRLKTGPAEPAPPFAVSLVDEGEDCFEVEELREAAWHPQTPGIAGLDLRHEAGADAAAEASRTAPVARKQACRPGGPSRPEGPPSPRLHAAPAEARPVEPPAAGVPPPPAPVETTDGARARELHRPAAPAPRPRPRGVLLGVGAAVLATAVAILLLL